MKRRMERKDKPDRRHFRVLSGGQDPVANLGSILVVAGGPEEAPPFQVEASVMEEDTFLVLSAEPIVVDPLEEPIRLMTRLIETRQETPGSVLVRGSGPYRMLAIVHDVEQDPTWREEWVAEALEQSLREAEARELRCISLEMLGCMHGRLGSARFAALFEEAVLRVRPRRLKRVWLRVPRKRNPGVVARMLREAH